MVMGNNTTFLKNPSNPSIASYVMNQKLIYTDSKGRNKYSGLVFYTTIILAFC